MNSLTAIDLFCGCGGLTLGLKQAGFSVIGAVDNDSLSVETYRVNHGEVRIWETDIRKLKVSQVKKELHLRRAELDLLAGCPPCQGFSAIRTLNRSRCIRDARNDLIFEFLRFVEELRPKAIMFENVPGLAHNNRFKRFCLRLHDLGYTYEHRILNAADYGVPQRRRRLILIGSRLGRIDFAVPSSKHLTVRDAIASLKKPGSSGDPLHDISENRSRRILNLIKRIPKNGGGRTDLAAEYQLACHKKCNGFKDIYGRMAWDEIAPTITSGCVNPSKGRFLHPQQDRAITLREAALLQSFPPEYQFSLRRGKYLVARLIGNALPPQFIRRVSLQVKKTLESV